MRSPLVSFVITAALGASLYIALDYGRQLHSEWTYWGIIVSGFLWWVGAMLPVWFERAVRVPAVLNSGAASAAVFAGLTSLTEQQVTAAMNLLHR
jgi:hypothetical protein